MVYGFWNSDLTRVEIGKFDTFEQCEQASTKLLRSQSKAYLCIKEQENDNPK
jgi:hypothetical protein